VPEQTEVPEQVETECVQVPEVMEMEVPEGVQMPEQTEVSE
jgi:hypothetical protein